MKKHRQLIALNLVLVLLLSLFPGVAFAAETEAAAESAEQITAAESGLSVSVEPMRAAEDEPSETPDENILNLTSGETATFVVGEDDNFPQLAMQVDRPDAYTLRFRSPGETNYSVGIVSWANLMVNGNRDYERRDGRGVSLFMQPSKSYVARLERTMGDTIPHYDFTGEWTVTLEPAERTQLALAEEAAVTRALHDREGEYFSINIEQSGEYTVSRLGADPSKIGGTVYVCRDTELISQNWMPYYNSYPVAFTAEAGDRLIISATNYTLDDAAIRVDRLTNGGVFGAQGDNLSWQFDEDAGRLTISGTGSMGELRWNPWIALRYDIRSVVIGQGVTDVADGAFASFQISSATLADSITRIGNNAFNNCLSLMEIKLPADLVSVGERAFFYSDLKNVTIPAHVSEIGAGAFGAYSLNSISLAAGNTAYQLIDGVLYTADGTTLVCFPSGKCAPCIIPDTVTTVMPEAFYRARFLKAVYIPLSVEQFAFSQDVYPKTFRYAGTEAQLRDVMAEDWFHYGTFVCDVENSGDTGASLAYHVSDNGLHETMHYTPQTTGLYAAAFANFTGYRGMDYYTSSGNMPLCVASGGETIRSGWNGAYGRDVVYLLEGGEDYDASLELSESGDFEIALQRLNPPVITLGENTVSGGYCLFTAPETGWYAFAVKNDSGEDVSNIWVCDGHSKLNGMICLQAGGTAVIDTRTTSRAAVTVSETQVSGSCGENVTWAIDDNYCLTISGTGPMADYSDSSEQPWNSYRDAIRSIVVEDGVTSIGNYAFYGCSQVTAVAIAASVKTIGESAFSSCTGLESITIPNGTQTIGADAFFLCEQLKTVRLGSSVREIGAFAFGKCYSLQSFRLSSKLETLDESVFYWSRVESFTLPSANTHFVLEDGVLYDSDHNTLYHCAASRTGEVVIPDGVKVIAPCAFYGCDQLQTIRIPHSLTRVGEYTAQNAQLEGVYYDGSFLDWKKVQGEASFYAPFHYLREPEAPAVSLGEHEDTFSGDNSTVVYSFTAPETGLYRISSESVPVDLIDSEGNDVMKYWADSAQLIQLDRGEQIFLSITAYSASSVHWSITSLNTTHLTTGERTDQVSTEGLAFLFVPEESGRYQFDMRGQNCSLSVRNSDFVEIMGDYGTVYQRTVSMTAGESYYILLSAIDNLASLTWSLEQAPMPPVAAHLALGENTVEVNGEVYCAFTPETSGKYRFFGMNEGGDTYATLYNDSFEPIVSDDDTAGNLQFWIQYVLEAGKTYYLGVRFYDSSASGTIRVGVESSFAITQQPQDYFGAVGTNAVFTVAARGDGLQYQWQYQNPGSSVWKNSASTTDSVTCYVTAERSGRLYRCVITDENGNQIISDAACITVITPLEITAQPQDFTGEAGETATFTVRATGDGLQYQWQYQNPGSEVWKNSASTTDTATCALTTARSGRLYRCIIMDAYGSTVTTRSALLSVRTPLKITAQPQDFTGKAGDTATFTVKATGDGLQYHWQYQNPGSTAWKDSASTTNTATCALTTARSGRLYRCVITDAYGNSVTTRSAKLTVAVIKITQQPQDFTGALGDTATFTVKATGDGLQYQWQYQNPGSEVWKNSASTTNTATCALTTARSGRLYRCIITDAYGNTATTRSAKITVMTALKITAQPQDFTGASGDVATFTVKAAGDGLTYQWQFKDVGGSWKNSSATTNKATCTLTTARNGRLYRCVITDAYGNSVTTRSAKITVMTALKITQQPQDFTGKSGDTATFTVKATGDGLQYQWQYQNPGSSVWKNSSATTNTATCTLTTARNGRLYRCIITDAYGNTVTSSAAKIIVTA